MKKALSLVLLCLCGIPIHAAIPDGVDSTLYVYYRRCNDNIREASVFATIDTLYRLSVQKNDVRMQAAAFSMRADHYYFTNNIDSLKVWVPRVKAFAREHDQLKYYYFVWNRLILHYTKNSQYTLAQYELQQMLKQADKDNYKPGTAQAYQQLAHIYRLKRLLTPSLEYYLKAIDDIEHNNKEYHSLGNLYIQLSDAYFSLGRYDEAYQALDKATELVTLPSDLQNIGIRRVHLFALRNQPAEARRLLRKIQSNGSVTSKEELLIANQLIANAEENYPQALYYLNQLIAEYRRLGTDESYYSGRFRSRAELLAQQGDFQAAYKEMEHYQLLYEKRIAADSEQSLSEFATLFEVTRLAQEKTEAQQQAQAGRLHLTYLVITALIVLIVLATLFIFLLTRMNRRLARAKRAAEESNRMKGIFIRTITHEINTPLNAIVGFSELASTAPSDDQERGSYLQIIRENSEHLQKLVTDVLYISDLESSEDAPAIAAMDVNTCCMQCISEVTSAETNGIGIFFLPDSETCTIDTSRQLVGRALTELLRNAARFARPGSATLAWSLSEAPRQITFTVTDTGPGIPAAEAERIFERFVKLDPFSQGMGLGLGVCRLIADSLGGSIRLDTSYTGGARFIFTIPAA